MADSRRPLFSGLQAELGSLVSDIREMAELRWELARLEFTADARATARLLVVLAVALLMTLVALPVLVVSLGSLLDGIWGISQSGWLCIFGLVLLVTAGIGGFLAWRRFRRNFIGLAETLEELREDMLWLREWQEGAGISDDE
ncbi:MAG: phage holin family protein [Planctomycetota bacterium]|nr:phage holin family protein [Planctomycetota bacterium]